VALSTRAFTAIAKTHDEFVRAETAARLNEKGSSRIFQVGDKVKVRVPPTQTQLLETGRRAKHVTAWRGPCTILERLSTTAYAAVDDTTKRRYELVISNILPFRAVRAKSNANAQFNEIYSSPFVVDEFIAIRDEPRGPFYVALVEEVASFWLKLFSNPVGTKSPAMKSFCNGHAPSPTNGTGHSSNTPAKWIFRTCTLCW
jgi:hypothetical protein